jgi:hypothetical protein
MLVGAIGLLTLVLAATGLYGMMAYSVARQTQEIGIRMAIGATRSDISRMVLREAVTLVAAGSVIGVGIALLVMRPLAMFLVASLTPADPLSLGGVVVVLNLTALAASLSPMSCRSRRSRDDAEVRLTPAFPPCARGSQVIQSMEPPTGSTHLSASKPGSVCATSWCCAATMRRLRADTQSPSEPRCWRGHSRT